MAYTKEPQVFGGKHVNDNIVCIGCRYAYGEPPFEDTPQKSNCEMYPDYSGETKPNDVYFDGAPCPYRLEK
ncbi:hypothetical protein SAMN04515656_10335 [Eubacterium aggregans]|uniref:Uncharacterized protein n=1 Tax=Eubacterium aggregans TaxID=81409 RepID=A0A1H3Y4J4_9FIRM|nr:hypothetical protein [Eubacterium aggregans]SEA05772.1 hypothetical protein SAMN04515656_10335 [Eubacterium aggregans]